MVDGLNISGICSTCNNRPECRTLRNSMRINSPVLHCEEFDNFSPGMEIDTDVNTNRNSYEPPDPLNEMIPGRSMGLCLNCENRKACMLPCPEGGVLHCEEYM